MKLKNILIALLLITSFGYAQHKIEYCKNKFDYNTDFELGTQFVMMDNYNSYLLSVENVDGMISSNQVIIRKFDQKNQLVNTFKQDFPEKNNQYLHKYLGSFPLGNDKVVVFTKTYSNKSKKSEIHKIIFDKTTSVFTTTLLVSYDIESLSKSGDANVYMSENKRFIGFVFKKDASKKEPEVSDCIVLNASTLDVVWQKEATFTDEYRTSNKLITNSGKMLFIRNARGFKLDNYLSLIDANGQNDFRFEENLMIQQPIICSIGDQDYFVSFNYRGKGLRGGDFEKLMLFDLQSGKILKNNDIKDFISKIDLNDVAIRNVFLQNNEIYIFAEAKYKTGVKPDPRFTNPNFGDPIYKFGPAKLYVLSFEGELKRTVNINTDRTLADIYHSFGLLNIKGSNYINTGFSSGLYPFNLLDEKFDVDKRVNFNFNDDPYYPGNQGNFVNQLIHYSPDKNTILLARIFPDNKMSFVSVTDYKQ